MVGCLIKTKLWLIFETTLYQQPLATRFHLKKKLQTPYVVVSGWLPKFGLFQRPHVSFFPQDRANKYLFIFLWEKLDEIIVIVNNWMSLSRGTHTNDSWLSCRLNFPMIKVGHRVPLTTYTHPSCIWNNMNPKNKFWTWLYWPLHFLKPDLDFLVYMIFYKCRTWI